MLHRRSVLLAGPALLLARGRGQAQSMQSQPRDRRLGGRHRHGSPCAGDVGVQVVFGRINRIRRRTEFTHIAGRCRDAGMLPVINEECVRQAIRTGTWIEGKGKFAICL